MSFTRGAGLSREQKDGGDRMFSHNGRISTRQVMILLVLQMFNINMILIPKISTYYVGRNGYILPIIAILLGIIYVYFITALTMRFPDKTLVEITKALLPNGIAYIVVWIFAAKLLIGTGLELRMFGELISQVMLPRTPLAVIMLVMLLTAGYLVKSGIEATARMSEVLIYFIMIPVAIVLIMIAVQVDYQEVLPFLQTDIKSVGWGALSISYMFTSLEFLLMMTGLMRKPRKVRKVGIGAVCVIGIVQGIMTLLTIAEIGVGETQREIWPVLGLLQSIGINNSVVENQEVILLGVWILSVFIYISSGLYFASLIGGRSFKFRRENVFVLPLIPIIFFIAIAPRNIIEAYEYYLKCQMYFSFWFVVVVPLVLLLIAKLRRIGDEK